MTVLEPAPAFLFVWLKDEDPKEACRFRVDLREVPAGGRRVSLPLSSPERKTEGFDSRNVREVHLVLDDVDDGQIASGSIRLSGFRLESRLDALDRPGHREVGK